ncbi:hypothetical protein EON66_08300 [archaeon]|nr:MAG: hypothetical protein EON66_08300 [archaeon]
MQDASEGSTHPQDASVQVSPSVLEATPAEGVKTEEGAAPSSELAATGEEDSSAAASELSVHGGVQLSQGMQANQGVQPADVLSLLETWHSRILESRSNSAAMTAHVASSNVLKVLARRVKDLQSEQVLTSTFLVQALSALLDVHAQTSARVQQLEAQFASLAQAVQASSTPTPRATQVAALEQANADLSRRVATLEAALQHLVPATSPRYSTLIQEHVRHAWAAAQHWRTRAWSTLRTLELPAWATRLLPSPHPSLGVSAHVAPSQSAHASSAPPPHVEPTPHASPSADAPLQATQETAVEAVVPRVVVEVSPPQAAHTPAVSQAIKPAVLSSAHGTVLADALWHQRMSVASLVAVITLALALAAYRKWVAGDRRARLARGTVFDSKTGDVSSTCCCNRRRPAVPTGGEYLVPVPPFPPYAADQPLRSPFLTPEITPRRSRRSRSPADSPVSPSFFSSSPT